MILWAGLVVTVLDTMPEAVSKVTVHGAWGRGSCDSLGQGAMDRGSFYCLRRTLIILYPFINQGSAGVS